MRCSQSSCHYLQGKSLAVNTISDVHLWKKIVTKDLHHLSEKTENNFEAKA